MIQLTEKYDIDTKLQIKERDNYQCFFCRSTEYLTIAHIFVTKKEGGKAVEENGMCICRKCHDKLDFGMNCSEELQKKMQRLCEMYLTLYYMREINKEELTLPKVKKEHILVKKRKK